MTILVPCRQIKGVHHDEKRRRLHLPWPWLMTLLAVLALQLSTPARAECSFDDAVAAVKQAIDTTAVCQPVCAKSKYNCYGAAGLAIVLTEVSRRNDQGQDTVDSFCSSVQNLLGKIKDNAEAVKEILDLLEKMGLTTEQSENVSSILAAVGDAMAVVNCACQTEQLQLQNESSFGACLNDALEEIGCGKIDFSTATIGGCDPVGGIISDLVNEALDELVDLGCGWAWHCATGSAGPISDCVAGTQHDEQGKCHYCSEFGPHVITLADGRCGCEAPYSGLWHGRDLMKMDGAYCSCRPPSMNVDGHCLCAAGSELKDGGCRPCSNREYYVPFQYVGGVAQMPSCKECPIGTKPAADQLSCVNWCDNSAGEVLDLKTFTCVACPKNAKAVYTSGSVGHCEACEFGQAASADHKSCVAACAPGQVMGGLMLGKDQQADPAAYQCETCPENTFASYETSGSSRGACLPCPDGTYAYPGATACKALTCGPGAYQDPGNPHACKSCPSTQIYIPTEKKIVTGPGNKKSVKVIPGHCGCGEKQKPEGGACVCVAGAVKIDLPQAGNGLFACVCPEGTILKDGKCRKASKEKPVTGKQKVIPKPRCAPGEVLNAMGQCVKRKTKPAPKATRLPPAKPDVPSRILPAPSRRLVCPPGTVPGPLGKRCIPIRR